MTNLTIQNLDDPLTLRLQASAARHGHSIEEEAGRILRAALVEERQASPNLGEAIRQRFAPFGGVEMTEPAHDVLRAPPDFA